MEMDYENLPDFDEDDLIRQAEQREEDPYNEIDEALESSMNPPLEEEFKKSQNETPNKLLPKEERNAEEAVKAAERIERKKSKSDTREREAELFLKSNKSKPYASFFNSRPTSGREEVTITLPDGQVYYVGRFEESAAKKQDKLGVESTSLNLLASPIEELLRKCQDKLVQKEIDEKNKPSSKEFEEGEERHHHSQQQGLPSSFVLNRSPMTMVSLNVKYAPKFYGDLLTHERTTREVLKWISHHKKTIKDQQQQHQATTGGQEEGKGSLPNFAEMNYKKKILLLGGPPGCGKTTLAKVLAHHAGFVAREINASDDRNKDALMEWIKNNSQSHGIDTHKKNLIVLDEIDGSTDDAIQALLAYLPKLNSTPIICICNDLYHPSLKQLKQHAYVVRVAYPTRSVLVRRLKDICKTEAIVDSPGALEKLCSRMGDDIRACLTALDFYIHSSSSSSSAEEEDVMRTNNNKNKLTEKIVEQLPCYGKDLAGDIWTTWNTILLKKDKQALTLLEQVTMCEKHLGNDFDILMEGVKENFVTVPRTLDVLHERLVSAYEWLLFGDVLQRKIHSEMDFGLYSFVSFILPGVRHCILPNSMAHTKNKKSLINFPMKQVEFHRKHQHSHQVFERCDRVAFASFSFNSFFTDLASYIAPILAFEKKGTLQFMHHEELKRGLTILREYGIGITPDSEKPEVLKLDPDFLSLLCFSVGELPQNTLRILAEHVSKSSRKRQREKAMVASSTTATAPKQAPVVPVAAVPGGEDHKKAMKRVDFFGRVIDQSQSSQDSTTYQEEITRRKAENVLFRFNEGYSDAVRKNVTMRDIFTF